MELSYQTINLKKLKECRANVRNLKECRADVKIHSEVGNTIC